MHWLNDPDCVEVLWLSSHLTDVAVKNVVASLSRSGGCVGHRWSATKAPKRYTSESEALAGSMVCPILVDPRNIEAVAAALVLQHLLRTADGGSFAAAWGLESPRKHGKNHGKSRGNVEKPGEIPPKSLVSSRRPLLFRHVMLPSVLKEGVPVPGDVRAALLVCSNHCFASSQATRSPSHDPSPFIRMYM